MNEDINLIEQAITDFDVHLWYSKKKNTLFIELMTETYVYLKKNNTLDLN